MATVTLTPNAFVELDHGNLLNLLADHHTQYLLLLGRAGGQDAIGGTAASEVLGLRGSSNANLGSINVESPITLDVDFSVSPLVDVIRWAPTIPSSGAAITSVITAAANVTIDSGVFIMSTVKDISTYEWTVSPGFAVVTLFLAQAVYTSSTAAVAPAQCWIYASQCNYEVDGTGVVSTSAVYGFNHAPRQTVRQAGDNYTIAQHTAVRLAPVFSTHNATATADFGTIRGLDCANVVQFPAFFGGAGLGTETMDAYIGLEYRNMTFGGNVTKAAVRSAQTFASNAYVILATGGAQSDWGGGNHLDCGFVQCAADNVGISLGAGPADVIISWNGTGLEFDALIAAPDLRWVPNVADHWTLTTSATKGGFGIDIETIVFGTTAPDPTGANYFVQFAAPNLRAPTVGGEYADVLWTAGGSIAVSGFAISNLDAFKINAVGYTLGGGSVSDVSTLHVAAMSSDGIATRSHALRVQGRTRVDGHMNHNESTAVAQLTADVTQLTLPANNGMRHVYLVDADANGPWTIEGILNIQVGDSFYIINDGANAYILGHQDAGAAAADRIISPTGADLTLAADEMAKLWYDSTVSRWRILETTGA